MKYLSAKLDRGFLSVFNHFGNKMQYCRRYYSAARACGGFASGKTTELRHCAGCIAKVFWSRTDSRICDPRSFTTSCSLLVDLNKKVETKETSTESGSKVSDGTVVEEEEDFFGFEGGHGVVDVGEPVSVAESVKKYEFLFNHVQEKSEEKLYVTSFGSLRFDRDNQPGKNKRNSQEDDLRALMRENKVADEQQTTFSSSPIRDKHFQSAGTEILHRDDTRNENFTGEPPNYMEKHGGGTAIQRVARKLCDEMASTQNLAEEQHFRKDRSEIKHRNPRPTDGEGAASGITDVRENPIEEQYFNFDKSEIKRADNGRMKSESAVPGFPDAHENPIEEQYFHSELSQIKHRNMGQTKSEHAASGFLNVQENPIEEQYFNFDKSEIKQVDNGKMRSESTASGFPDVRENPIEEQYFGRESSTTERPESVLSNEVSECRQTERASSFIDEQYFSPDGTETVKPSVESAPTDSKTKRKKVFIPKVNADGNASVDMDFVNELLSEPRRYSTAKIVTDPATVASVESSSDDWRGSETKRSDRKSSGGETAEDTERVEVDTGRSKPQAKERIKPDIENPKTAFDFAMKLRHERKMGKSSTSTENSEDSPIGGHGMPEQKVDSFGFRLYGDQIVDLRKEPEFMVLKMLEDCVLYNENDILALAKPYGLPVHDGAGHRHFLTKYLPELAKRFCAGYDSRELYTVHRLDKETTGVILLAKTQQMADRLHDMFEKGEVQKTYWALTKGTPSPLEGIIDIPIGEATVAGKLRMVLKPPYSAELSALVKKSSTRAKKAVTHFKVLASNGNAALVELSPSTGVKHQLRVHLASALSCPVLGDHKYSHLSKLAPQKLPSDVLQRLHMRQSKVRTLAMHLHARGVVLPEIADGKNVIIGAKLPKHFTQNMKRLKIKYEKN